MSWKLTAKEYESVLSLPAQTRYEYFVKKAADCEIVWSLGSAGGWALSADDSGQELVPVWPHERFARGCASGAWHGYEPRSIDLATWLNRWLPGIERDSRLVAVFPVPSGKGVPVDPERLKKDLEEELLKYE